jgi:hypothetical protein
MICNHIQAKYVRLIVLIFLIPNFLVAFGSQQTEQSITGIEWQWVQILETGPARQHVIPDPENYTLRFFIDGNISVQT